MSKTLHCIALQCTHSMLAVILDPEGEEGVYYPATARPASRRERRLYGERKGGANR